MATTPNPVKAPSFSDAAKTANLPKRVKTEDIGAMGTVTWLSAHGDTKNLPDGSGTTDGFEVVIEDDSGRQYNAFIGGQVLVMALARLEFPFRASLKKDGRTWIFAD